jgi:CRP-like cAMP-binding protein
LPKIASSLIAGLPLFADIETDALEQMLRSARLLRIAKDRVIFEQEADAENFYLLLKGYIRVMRSNSEGEQVIVRVISEGQLFGIAPALGRTTYPANAIAATDCTAIAWPSRRWAEIVERCPSFGTRAARTIDERLQEVHSRVMELSTERVEQRVARTLLRLIGQAGHPTKDGVEIGFPISRQQIAEMTGTTLHTVSRLISAWESQGIVRGTRQKVLVLDSQALWRIAENRGER